MLHVTHHAHCVKVPQKQIVKVAQMDGSLIRQAVVYLVMRDVGGVNQIRQLIVRGADLNMHFLERLASLNVQLVSTKTSMILIFLFVVNAIILA